MGDGDEKVTVSVDDEQWGVDAPYPGPVVLEELGDYGGLGDAEPLGHSTYVG